MSDPTAGQQPALEPASQSYVAPSGGAGQGLEAEQQSGTAAAEANAKAQEEARDRRSRETLNARQIVADRVAATDKKQSDRAEEVRGMVKDRLPPAGPGLPEIDSVVIAATIDPNNEVLNPDMSKLGSRLSLPPGARVPKPVLPQDSTETQLASKPLSDEHAKEAQEVAKGLPEPVYPPAGSQPTVELSPEEEEKYGRGDRRNPRRIEQQPYATDALAQPEQR